MRESERRKLDITGLYDRPQSLLIQPRAGVAKRAASKRALAAGAKPCPVDGRRV
jgi:hypothetical protein